VRMSAGGVLAIGEVRRPQAVRVTSHASPTNETVPRPGVVEAPFCGASAHVSSCHVAVGGVLVRRGGVGRRAGDLRRLAVGDRPAPVAERLGRRERLVRGATVRPGEDRAVVLADRSSQAVGRVQPGLGEVHLGDHRAGRPRAAHPADSGRGRRRGSRGRRAQRGARAGPSDRAGARRVASRTLRQSSTGCGGWQRRSPTGGAAYGMPWKRR
jgi:hypothetical protein